jgi:branched-chain amino acid transport system substrate-binding protein
LNAKKEEDAMKRSLLAVAIAAIGFLAAGVAPTARAAEGPIRIGFLAPLTGPFADVAKDMVEGTKLALKKLNGKIAGRPLELVVEDTAADPNTGLSKARFLVEQKKVDLIAGIYHGGVAMAVAAYVKRHKFPLVITAGGGASAVMYKVKPQPWVVRASHSIAAMHKALGFYTASVLHKRRAVTMAWDYVAGRDGAAGFKEGFEAGGGRVIKQLFFKLGTPDFSPYFAAIPAAADVVQMFVTGADAVRFVRQFEELGYKAKFPLVADALGVSDRLLPEEGAAAEGIVANETYMATAATPGNQEFVEAYKKDTGGEPGVEGAYCYAGMLYIAKAIAALHGNLADRAKLVAALAKSAMPQSVRGPFSFNKMNDIIFTVAITRVVKSNTGFKNAVLKTYKKVDALAPLPH